MTMKCTGVLVLQKLRKKEEGVYFYFLFCKKNKVVAFKYIYLMVTCCLSFVLRFGTFGSEVARFCVVALR